MELKDLNKKNFRYHNIINYHKGDGILQGKIYCINYRTITVGDDTSRYTIKYNNIIPIPLSEEWLLKLGGKKIESVIEPSFSFVLQDEKIPDPILGGCLYKYKEISLMLCNDTGKGEYYAFIREGTTTDRQKDDIVCLTRELNFVHSFQNLYYAITNEELIK